MPTKKKIRIKDIPELLESEVSDLSSSEDEYIPSDFSSDSSCSDDDTLSPGKKISLQLSNFLVLIFNIHS